MNLNPEKNISKNEAIPNVSLRKEYTDLVNDFGIFITLNASKIEQQMKPEHSKEADKIRTVLRSPIINGLNYSDFISQNWNKLTNPQVAQALVTQIHALLVYLQPRMNFFQKDAPWKVRFTELSKKYTNFVNNSQNQK
jgi:hypothetical protein